MDAIPEARNGCHNAKEAERAGGVKCNPDLVTLKLSFHNVTGVTVVMSDLTCALNSAYQIVVDMIVLMSDITRAPHYRLSGGRPMTFREGQASDISEAENESHNANMQEAGRAGGRGAALT